MLYQKKKDTIQFQQSQISQQNIFKRIIERILIIKNRFMSVFIKTGKKKFKCFLKINFCKGISNSICLFTSNQIGLSKFWINHFYKYEFPNGFDECSNFWTKNKQIVRNCTKVVLIYRVIFLLNQQILLVKTHIKFIFISNESEKIITPSYLETLLPGEKKKIENL